MVSWLTSDYAVPQLACERDLRMKVLEVMPKLAHISHACIDISPSAKAVDKAIPSAWPLREMHLPKHLDIGHLSGRPHGAGHHSGTCTLGELLREDVAVLDGEPA